LIGVRAAMVAAILAASLPASAGPPEVPPADAKAQAVVHFERGVALYDKAAWAAALAEFVEAQQLHPLRYALYDAGLCLEKLQQYDEALERFEATLRDFGETMPAREKALVQGKVLAMRDLVGEVAVDGAEPGASVSVDGLPRGEHPLLAPLRVAAGSHVVRVSKAGFETFEARVIVAGRQTEHIAARLKPLGPSGRVRIAEQDGKALDVLVDGSRMGTSPWEGPLAPGPHVVVLRGEGKLGTPPVQVTVEVDRTTPLTLAAEELAAALRVEPVPANASVAIDGVTVGRGTWDGRLLAGSHKVEVAAPGFFAEARRLGLAPDRHEVLRVTLDRDESSPFWRKPPRKPRFLVEATTAVVLVPSFQGKVAGECVFPCQASLGGGGSVSLHAGYELGAGLGFGVTVGYLEAVQNVVLRATNVTTTLVVGPAPGTVDDRLALRGALLGAWVGYTLGERVPLHFRVGAGALAGGLLDERTNGAFTASDGTMFSTGPLIERHTAVFFYVTPEARVGWPVGKHVVLQAGLAVPVLIGLRLPAWDMTHTFRAGSGVGQFAADSLAGPVVVAIDPEIGARYDF
jgi:PEGA domain